MQLKKTQSQQSNLKESKLSQANKIKDQDILKQSKKIEEMSKENEELK